jgi:RNA polymerase sigma-70 factor (ECF subfamily)
MDESQATRLTLLARIQDPADHQAWSQFLEIYTPLVYRLLRRKGLQDADAADVSQEVFRTVARSVKDFRGGSGKGSFRSWLAAVSRSRLVDFAHRRNRQVPGTGDTKMIALLEQQPSPDEDEVFEDEYRKRVLEWAAEKIRGQFQDSTWQAFWQTNVEGKPTEEVAASLGMSLGAVYIARSRVLARLKKQIELLEEY